MREESSPAQMVMLAKTPKIKQRTASDLKERNGGGGGGIKRWNCGGCLLEHTFRPDGVFEVGHS